MSTKLTAAILTAAWWKAAGIRALRTAVYIAIPYVAGASVAHIAWLAVLSAAGLGAIGSLATSLFNLPEATGDAVPIGLALLYRVVKTAAQSIIAGVGTSVLFQSVNWVTVLQTTAIACLGSLLVGVLGFLPESTLTTTPPAGATTVINVSPATAAAPADVAHAVASALTDQNVAAVPPAASSTSAK